ncbi:sterol desaturase family protein [Aureibacter tunicatorum]|uniref:Sterol desaturase/sphingolipid hydroxylase (Fatty acid hydroxylase superfamily) n=1 Tax=Aureibacter tunicatorum TaxID=866807 RepID=A0AAE3XIS2_9BACT|nr:sterol desaturase family protein [Aureibacter tunicatorum]MDR6237185.1 sterol desaturase/sphingolipid hydroxylase (fatty acid hydroxylase superfamily) [Aureibacter tunicatorum]BDD06177.1 hypothetical protein AUTU_36600 [Aureibacter tunicatorum]
MDKLIYKLIDELSYFEWYVLTAIYFLLLYFGGVLLFSLLSNLLEKKAWIRKLSREKVSESQKKLEVRDSLHSILIFGFSSLPIIYLLRHESSWFADNTLVNVLVGLLALNVWNEIHFFIVHRLMHTPWLIKNVHFIHHRSRVPTYQSVFSFHWLEALLLSTVPITLIPFIKLSPMAIALYPICSIFFNFIGHSNYILCGKIARFTSMSSRHHNHHRRGKDNFGFVSYVFDEINLKIKQLTQRND